MSAASAHFQIMCQTMHAHCTKPFLSLEARTRVENKLHCSGEACWWTVHPASKQRSEGEKVWKFTKRWILFHTFKLYPKITKCHIYIFHPYILSSNFIRSSQKYFFQSSNFVCQGSCWRRCHFCVRCYWEVKKSNNKSTSEFINLTIRIVFWGQRNQLLLAKLSSKVHFYRTQVRS